MKILVVEDDRHIADNIKKGLEIKSHVVDAVYDGEEGYDFAVAEDYDLIILDRMLPGLDGLEICRGLRKEKITTPILMLTAKTMVEDRVDGLDSGADDYLGKPFAFEELLARVKAISRRPKSKLVTELKVADLTLNPETYEVKRSGRNIKLSKKEFALLEFLMRNAGQIFSKEKLIERVWDIDADVLSNTAQVYIGYLRDKIDRPFPAKPSLITTVRGFGYKLDEEGGD